MVYHIISIKSSSHFIMPLLKLERKALVIPSLAFKFDKFIFYYKSVFLQEQVRFTFAHIFNVLCRDITTFARMTKVLIHNII